MTKPKSSAPAEPVVVELSALLRNDPRHVAVVEAALESKGFGDFAAWQRSLTVPVGPPDFQSLRRLGAHCGFAVKE